ncbi:transmembrane protein 115 homolog [Diutina catenulata]
MGFSIGNVPISTRALVGAVTFISGIIFVVKINGFQQEVASDPNVSLTFHDVLVPNFQLIPKSTFTHPWVLVTAIFAEISVFAYLLSVAVLFFGSRYVETYWGWKEVVQFVVLVGSVTNMWTVMVTIVSNIFRSDVLGMNKPLGGGMSYYVGFLVVLKQLIPEHNLVLFQGAVSVRVKQLVSIFMVIVTVWSLVMRTLYPVVPFFGAFIASYVYLRFFQKASAEAILPGGNDGSILIGDASDTFQLTEFFPAQIRPYLAPVFNAVYEFAALAGIITPFNDDDIEQSNIRAAKRQEGQKSVGNSVAERRRQVALQVIEERIKDSTTAEN